MTELKSGGRLSEIVAGASQLSIEHQQCVLSVIKGMLFTRSLLRKQEERSDGSRPRSDGKPF